MRAPEEGGEVKSYLGDGVYIDHGSYRGEIVLTTEYGSREPTNTIILGPDELRFLDMWLERENLKSQ
jgi:hypothetical protein